MSTSIKTTVGALSCAAAFAFLIAITLGGVR